MTTFRSTRGGVMTVEVGSVTGDLELSTEESDGGISVYVRYVGASEWYTVEGSPVSSDTFDGVDVEENVLATLTTPREQKGFNEEPCSLVAPQE